VELKTVFRARVLTPTDPDAVRWLDDAILTVIDGIIDQVGPYDGRAVDVDLRPDILMPGFVDSHIHFPQAQIIGSASGPLLEWLERTTFPEEERFASAIHAMRVAATFCDQLVAAGTTMAMIYGSVHPEASECLLKQMYSRGLRGIVGPVLMDQNCPDSLKLSADRALPALDDLADRWDGRDGRLRVAVIPRFALTCTREILDGAGQLARERGLWVSTHLSENPAECAAACELFGARDYLSIYEEAGLVTEKSVYAHCVHLSASEWDRFAQAGAVVAHCPDSNDFLGSGGMPLSEVENRGIPMSIGTDVAAGRSFRIPHILASAYDNSLRVGHPVRPERLLWWATRGGALSLGHPQVGALAVGLEADMVQIQVPEWVGDSAGVLASVIFDRGAPAPVRTWVRGQQVAGSPV
jgi:guanine deaminase